MAGRPILIVAHPGHELNLFCWMERNRPRVYILTDGSGGAGPSRTPFSENCVRLAGASAGAVFGTLPDRHWYSALVAGPRQLLMATVDALLSDIGDAPPVFVVADPSDGYNPVHDLCAAVADTVHAVLARDGSATIRACYRLPSGAQLQGEAISTIRLNEPDQVRKRIALQAYLPLHGKISAALEAQPEALAVETLVRASGPEAWPDHPAIMPAYDRIAREHVAHGRYEQAISYQQHVLPAVRYLQGLGRNWRKA